MTMREMQIFLEVARTLNMSTAGKSLYLSQSTVSQSILNIDIIKSKVIANEGISVMASGQFKVEAKLGYLRGISLPEIKFRRHFYEIHHKDLHILPHIQSYLDTCMFRSITEFSCLNGTLF